LKTFEKANFFRKFLQKISAEIEVLELLESLDSGRDLGDLVAAEVQTRHLWKGFKCNNFIFKILLNFRFVFMFNYKQVVVVSIK